MRDRNHLCYAALVMISSTADQRTAVLPHGAGRIPLDTCDECGGEIAWARSKRTGKTYACETSGGGGFSTSKRFAWPHKPHTAERCAAAKRDRDEFTERERIAEGKADGTTCGYTAECDAPATGTFRATDVEATTGCCDEHAAKMRSVNDRLAAVGDDPMWVID